VPTWSPDGAVIAVSIHSPADSSRRLITLSVKAGTEKSLGSQRWLTLVGLGWLADGTGLLATGRDFETRNLQVWLVSYPEGNVRKVTNDLSSYSGVSLTADGKTLASVQGESLANIWLVPEGDSSKARRITLETGRDEGRSGLSLTPDGKIIYSARSTGIWDLWVVDGDGKNNRQLTLNTRGNFWPVVTSDGSHIVFISLRSGATGIWKTTREGGNPQQLVSGQGIVSKPVLSPDGRWIVYERTGDDRITRIWKVSIDGGDPSQLTHEYSEKPSVSPDGKFMICKYGRSLVDANRRIALMSVDGGAPLKTFDWPAVLKSNVVRWSADGRGLIYVDSRDRVYNLWTQPLDGSLPRPVTDFSSDQIFTFDVSRDGKVFALSRGRESSDVVLISNFK
jgi:Tol biopolymer transport system component